MIQPLHVQTNFSSIMKQRYSILIIIAFFSFQAVGQDGWTRQSTTYTSSLKAVHALDAMNVWAAGSNGLLIHSEDGGVTWDSVPTLTSKYLATIEFINADTGFVAGDDNETGNPYDGAHLLQRTVNGGQDWEFKGLIGGSQNTVFDLDFVEGPSGEPMRGYAVGGLANVWISYDWGDTWDHVSGDCGEGNFNSCYFADSITGWFVGTPSNVKPYTIMYTDDGGKSFIEQVDPNEIKLNGVCFGSELQGIAVGNSGIVMYTSDGGTTWETCTDEDVTGGSKTWFSVFLTETGKAWAVGKNGMIVHSGDWGHTWEAQASNTTQLLSEVYFINDNEGWIAGGLTENVVLHTTNGGKSGIGTGIEDPEEVPGTAFFMEQNYPNPFSTSTIINYTLGHPGKISLSVFDIAGRKIQSLVNEFQSEGKHSVIWDAGQFSDGIYFYELNIDQGPVCVKMMMLKR
jgi:photosystem II stability/assembly factor-like uncharacterized protein